MVLNSLEVLLINSFCDQGKVTWPLWASTTIKVNSLAIPTRGWYDREHSKSKCMWTCSTKGCLNPSVCLILMLPTTWIPQNTLGTWYSGHRPLARECWGWSFCFSFSCPQWPSCCYSLWSPGHQKKDEGPLYQVKSLDVPRVPAKHQVTSSKQNFLPIHLTSVYWVPWLHGVSERGSQEKPF